MGISKKIGNKGNFSKQQPATKKEIIEFTRRLPEKFTELIDVINSYYHKGGTFLVIDENETGITTSTIEISSDKNYVHTQLLPSNEWIVEHNLIKNPKVIIIDSANRKVEAEINYIDNNNLMIKFEELMTGKVYCN